MMRATNSVSGIVHNPFSGLVCRNGKPVAMLELIEIDTLLPDYLADLVYTLSEYLRRDESRDFVARAKAADLNAYLVIFNARRWWLHYLTAAYGFYPRDEQGLPRDRLGGFLTMLPAVKPPREILAEGRSGTCQPNQYELPPDFCSSWQDNALPESTDPGSATAMTPTPGLDGKSAGGSARGTQRSLWK